MNLTPLALMFNDAGHGFAKKSNRDYSDYSDYFDYFGAAAVLFWQRDLLGEGG